MSNEAETMKKKSKQTLTPQLRFPKFRKEPGWEEKSVNAISYVNPNHEGLPDSFVYIDLESVEQGKLVAQKVINREGAPSRAQRLLRKQDVIYQTVRPYQRNNLFFDVEDERDYVASTGYAQLRAHASPAFLFQLLHTNDFVKRVLAKCTGSNYPAINSSDLAAIEIAVPSPAEQQKIAECLSSLDGLIAAEGRTLEALKAHKKGLMQQLFPQPGQTQPSLRFPEFQKGREWGEKKLSEITSAIFDGTHQTPTYTEAGIPFYSVENLISGNANKFISKEDYDLETKKNKPEKGDILLTRIGKIGFSQVVTWDHEFSVYVTLAVIKRSSQFNSYYLHCLMQSDFYQSELRSKSLSNAVPPKINMDNLRETKVLVPILAEQQRIADCLISLDTQIAAQAAKIESLKQHKRGLMQQLFPVPEVS